MSEEDKVIESAKLGYNRHNEFLSFPQELEQLLRLVYRTGFNHGKLEALSHNADNEIK